MLFTRIQKATGLFVLLLVAGLNITPATAQLTTNGIYVGNQGNFSDANGTVSTYTPDTQTLVENAFPNLNTLVQSIYLSDNTGYIMANTSNRIDVVDFTSNTQIAQITDVPNPRYMASVNDDKAYVSDLFGSAVSIIDLTNNSVSGSVTAGKNPEDIAVIDGFAYVANSGFGSDSTLTIIDIQTDAVGVTLDLGCDGPRFLDVSTQNELWAFCTGKTVWNSDFTEIIEQTNGSVVIVDPTNNEVISTIELTAQLGAASSGQDAFHDINGDGKMYAVQGQSILIFNTETRELENTVDIPGSEQIGAVAFDAASDQLVLGRITGFTTAGFVSMHSLDGTETSRFNAGIAPTTIVLNQTVGSVANEPDTPAFTQTASLQANYPNPFTTQTTVTFELTQPEQVSLKVYNVLGAEVATLADRSYAPGSHQLTWRAADLPAGVYFAKFSAGDINQTRKMILSR